MIFDLDLMDSITNLNSVYDVCIVGAGPAGITLANEFRKSGKTVALCEGGGLEYNERSQSCYLGKITGESEKLNALDVSRLRYLGGTTGHWGGYCRTFTPMDFRRDYFDEKIYNWPINFGELNSYLERATKILELNPQFNDDTDSSVPFRSVEFQFSSKSVGEFRKDYLDEFNNSDGIHLFLNSNLVDIDGNKGTIKIALFSNYNKEIFRIRAKYYVFAMGGIETPRFMLWFAQKYGNKFFDDKTPIGKYWMEHPHTLNVGISIQKEFKSEFPLQDYNGFLINDALQRENGIFGCNVICYSLDNNKKNSEISSEIQTIAPNFSAKISNNSTIEYKIFIIDIISEQQPNSNNSISLSTTSNDKFGIPRVILDWKMSEVDRKTIKFGFSEFIKYFMGSDVGRMKLHDNYLKLDKEYTGQEHKDVKSFHKLREINNTTGNHHMGALRMYENAKYGVIDSNCKVFGSDNLFIAGSSVFTTGGVGNPTLPLIQLSLRLADHIVEIL